MAKRPRRSSAQRLHSLALVRRRTGPKTRPRSRENRELRQANEILRFCARPARILPRRSSTAGSSHDRLHRRSSRRPWVEPICRVLPIAPSTHHAHLARHADPEKAPARVRRDTEQCGKVRRVFEENFQVNSQQHAQVPATAALFG